MDLIDDARSLQSDLARLREALHRQPEVGLELPRTQERVLEALRGLPLEVDTGTVTTSVTAVLRGTGTPGTGGSHTVLLRGDMDALPVAERFRREVRRDQRRDACLRPRPAHRGAGRCRAAALRAP